MNINLTNFGNQIKKVQLYLLLVYCFFLSLVPSISIISLIVLGVTLLIQRPTLRRNALFYSFISVYLLLVLGSFYSSDTTQAFIELEQKLSLLIWPIALFALPRLSQERKSRIFDSFIIGCVVAVGYRLVHAFWFYDTQNLLFSTPFSNQLFNSHPTFAAIYAAFAFFLLADKVLFYKKKEINIWEQHKIIAGLCLFLLYSSLFFYASRMAIITFTIVLILATIVSFYKKKRLIKGLFLIGFEILLILGSIQAVSWLAPAAQVKRGATTAKRFERLQHKNTRVEIWKSAWGSFQSKPILGTGTGDVKDDLLAQYQARNFKYGIKNKYDAHNQYIEIALVIGFIGLLLFLLSLLLPFWIAFQQKEYLYLIFLMLFGLSCLTENILENQEGVLFYSFFNSFFACHFFRRV